MQRIRGACKEANPLALALARQRACIDELRGVLLGHWRLSRSIVNAAPVRLMRSCLERMSQAKLGEELAQGEVYQNHVILPHDLG